ncbi:MAG TPA: hypothetical protein VGE52_02090, partial [Pirellulales bacterium]
MSPTFWLEAMTAARRGRLYWIRFLYGSLLFIVLVTCLPRAGGLDTDLTVQRDHGARFGSTFFNAFAWVQTAGVLLICPAIFAGAVAGNRERGVLDHTLVTDLSSREIVFGKLAARLLEVFNFLLVAVPILALAM